MFGLSEKVYRQVPGDGKNPGCELRSVAKGGGIANHPDEDLLRDIVGVILGGILADQEGKDRGFVSLVKTFESVPVAVLEALHQCLIGCFDRIHRVPSMLRPFGFFRFDGEHPL